MLSGCLSVWRTCETNDRDAHLPACQFIRDEKIHTKRYQHLLSWFLVLYVLSMCAVLTPTVLARYFHHSHLISLEHAEMVTGETGERGGKDLVWRRTGQADEAGHFVSPGRDHGSACIKFCFLLFLKLVPSVSFGGQALNISHCVPHEKKR